jgi:ABC-type antimicrobial peptide transport system permease subunit
MIAQISFLAVFIGALGMLNTMLMTVMERTREIGVLRSLGWRQRQVLAMILKEALVLGMLGGLLGIPLGLALGNLLGGPLGRRHRAALQPRVARAGPAGRQRRRRGGRPLPRLARHPHEAREAAAVRVS